MLIQKKHLAELLLESSLHGPVDRLRSRVGFSPDMQAAQAILFNPKYKRQAKITSYREWLETNQPCVFGRVAAKNKNIFVCLLEDTEILHMQNGDQDVMDTIQDHRQVWKRLALEGTTSSFVVLLVSPKLVKREPDAGLKEISRRLMELYMQVAVPDDTFHTQREYVFLRRSKGIVLKFSTLPNIFCAQGDGRWWHDHRTPGGIMITSNALGHFMYARTKKETLDATDCAWALENAMRTISNAHPNPSGGKTKFKHCPATFLVPRQTNDPNPLKSTSPFANFSPDHYAGYFHTDHLIPSVFFEKERDPKELSSYDDLSLRYIFDSTADPQGHSELMAGIPVSWYEVKRDMDRLPDFVDPEHTSVLDRTTRGRLSTWIEQRIRQRCSG
ncbi:MAG TPA: hypothetical protein VI636_10805 [Candidatus Angelobacter sp.]